MAEPHWFRHAVRVGIFEYRKSVRAIWQDKGRLLLLAIGVLFPTATIIVFGYLFSSVLRDIGSFSISALFRGTVALFWLFGAFMQTQRIASVHTRIEAEPMMLTTVSARTVAFGLLLAEMLRVLTYLLPPLLALTGAVVYLFASPVSVLLIPVTVALFVLTIVVTGGVLGYAAAWLVARVPFIARHKTALGTIVVVLFFGGYTLFYLPQIPISISQKTLAVLPVGGFADLIAIGTPIDWSALHVTGVLLTSGLILVGGGIFVERTTASLWYQEPVQVDNTGSEIVKTDQTGAASSQTALATAIAPLRIPFISGPTQRVAEWAVLRALREPQRLNFLFVPLFAIGSSLISSGLQSNRPFVLLAPAAAVLLAWMGGVAFALNPFGDEGSVLPVTLMSVSGREYVNGLITPCFAFGFPLLVLGTVSTAFIASYTVGETVAFVFVGGLILSVAAVLAPALGMRFPRYSAIQIGQSDDIRPPRLLAAILHLGLTWVPGGLLVGLIVFPDIVQLVLAGLFGYVPAFVLAFLGGSQSIFASISEWFSTIGGEIQAFSLAPFRVGLGVVLLIGGVLVGWRAYRQAITQFEAYTLE